jgi:hypothetical protein
MGLIIEASEFALEKWLRDAAARSVIAKRLGVRNAEACMPDNMIEWHPVWTFNRSTGGKCLLRIILKLKGTPQFFECKKDDIDDTEVGLEDLMEYLQESYAKKLEPTQCHMF